MPITQDELAAQLANEIASRKAAEVAAEVEKKRADALQSTLSQTLKELASANDGEEIQAAAKRFLFSLPGFERRVPLESKAAS
jgi:hypothetical protein